MKKLISLALVLAPSVALACGGQKVAANDTKPEAATPTAPAAVPAEKFAYVSLDDLSAWHAAKAATIYDANKPETFAERHIPGATHVAYDKLTADKLPASKDSKLVFYCYNEQCSASHKAATQAADLGFKSVYVFAAGIVGWEKAGKPVEKAAPAAPAKADGQG